MITFAVVVILLEIQTGLAFQSSFIRDCLDAHNDVRALHGVPPIQWDTDIAVGAQKWANHLAAIDQMQHETSSPLGENLFYMYGGDPREACRRAVKNWYQEMKNYDFVTPHSDDSSSHFSQVVWRGTRKMGIGTAQSKSGNFFLVARYDPKGNIDGTFSDNVPGPLPASYLTRLEDSIGRNTSQNIRAPYTSIEQLDAAGTDNTGKVVVDSPIHDDKKGLMRFAQPSILLPKRGKDFRVELRFPDMEFTEDMKSPSSSDYLETKRKITEAIIQTYEDDDDFLEAQVISLRNGSVLATLGLLFSTVSVGHLNRLTGALGEERLGKFVVSPAYESAEALPAGYLKLTLPVQRPNDGVCPQPCSDPQICYKQGCLVSCCAFHPVNSPQAFQEHPLLAPNPPQTPTPAPPLTSPPASPLTPPPASPLTTPPPPPLTTPPPPPLTTPLPLTPPPSPMEEPAPTSQCAGTCDDRCSPYCDDDCCNTVNQPQPAPISTSPPKPFCPGSCNFACYPECIPGCCEEQRTAQQCPTPCPALCAPDCSANCCEARKSAIRRYQQLAALRKQAQRHPKINPFRGRPFFDRRPPQFHPLARPVIQRRPALAKQQRPVFYRKPLAPQNNYRLKKF